MRPPPHADGPVNLVAHHLCQGRHDPRLELRSCAAAHLGEGGAHAAAGAVGPVGADRVEGVGAEDDPADQRDLWAAEAVGIAVTVPALLRGAHPGRDLPELVDGAQDALADDRVVPDQPPLGCRRLRRLLEQCGRESDLADVVQACGDPDVLPLVPVHPELVGDPQRDPLHLTRVIRGLGARRAQHAVRHLSRDPDDAREPSPDHRRAPVAPAECRPRHAPRCSPGNPGGPPAVRPRALETPAKFLLPFQ